MDSIDRPWARGVLDSRSQRSLLVLPSIIAVMSKSGGFRLEKEAHVPIRSAKSPPVSERSLATTTVFNGSSRDLCSYYAVDIASNFILWQTRKPSAQR